MDRNQAWRISALNVSERSEQLKMEDFNGNCLATLTISGCFPTPAINSISRDSQWSCLFSESCENNKTVKLI